MESKPEAGWLGRTLRAADKVTHMRGMSNEGLVTLLEVMPDTAPHCEDAQRSRRETFHYMFDRHDHDINLVLARRPDLPEEMRQILQENAIEEHDLNMIEALAEGDRPMVPYMGGSELRAV